jgi:hypothetical protein
VFKTKIYRPGIELRPPPWENEVLSVNRRCYLSFDQLKIVKDVRFTQITFPISPINEILK